MKQSLLVLTVLVALTACAKAEVAPLPEMRLDPTRVGVAGISSGAYMAQQVHIAFSDRIIGAALLAGGPYGCAEGSLDLALSRCIKGAPDLPNVDALAQRAQRLAQAGKIAALAGLDGDRVLVAHGQKDALVSGAVTQTSGDLYPALQRASGATFVHDVAPRTNAGDYAHVWPTLSAGGDCGTTAAPYIGRCNIDFAGEIFSTVFDTAAPAPAAPAGDLIQFDQSEFRPGNSDAYLDDIGLLYRPPQCNGDKTCGLLIAFHGCEQNFASIGERFARESGLNRWADVANVVVLYPQTRATYMPLNPKACWDWWGYSGAEYDTRDGVQLRWVANAAARLGVKLLP